MKKFVLLLLALCLLGVAFLSWLDGGEPSAPATEESAAPARRAAHTAAEPAKAAPARSGGRHAMPEGARSSRPKAPGTYQGKH